MPTGVYNRQPLPEINYKTHPREFSSYRTMRQRCYNPNSPEYHNYGARGITVCERWLKSFAAFVEDMGLRPSQHSLDRYPNNLGNYEPGNCRWATPRQQSNNTRRCRYVTMDGRTQTLTQWAREIGIKPTLVIARVHVGWGEIEALMTPSGHPRHITQEGT